VIFTELEISGVWLIRLERRADPRGYFARTFCAEEFAAHGLPGVFVQCNISFNASAGTLRGLHWQDEPCQEGKLVRCSAGEIFDVAIDLRANSPTWGRWVAAALSPANGDALYIPPGFAHGFQALQDRTEAFYHMTEPYRDGYARGYRWDSPRLGITWPIANPTLSERDAALPLLA
jgi:dTDP-4-dehydrorhamnose 3,5-epimerase